MAATYVAYHAKPAAENTAYLPTCVYIINNNSVNYNRRCHANVAC